MGTTESLERVDRLEYICTLSYTPVLRLSYAGLTLFTRHAASRDILCSAQKTLLCTDYECIISIRTHQNRVRASYATATPSCRFHLNFEFTVHVHVM